jgi:hypothetical protein
MGWCHSHPSELNEISSFAEKKNFFFSDILIGKIGGRLIFGAAFFSGLHGDLLDLKAEVRMCRTIQTIGRKTSTDSQFPPQYVAQSQHGMMF